MATASLVKVSGQVRLNNGYDASGSAAYVNISMPNMSEDYWANNTSAAQTKYLAIATAMSPCLSKTIDSVRLTELSNITAE